MKARICLYVCVVIVVTAGWSATSCAFTELTDEQLDSITAGAAPVSGEDMMRFDFSRATKGGKYMTGHGSLTVNKGIIHNTVGNLQISDNAQSNLQSLVNINAVNSPVQVFLNLNLNINSTVGSMRQLNISGALPQ